MCTVCVLDAYRSQRKGLDPLELDLHMAVGVHVGAGQSPGPLQEQQLLISAEPSPAPSYFLISRTLKHLYAPLLALQ